MKIVPDYTGLRAGDQVVLLNDLAWDLFLGLDRGGLPPVQAEVEGDPGGHLLASWVRALVPPGEQGARTVLARYWAGQWGPLTPIVQVVELGHFAIAQLQACPKCHKLWGKALQGDTVLVPLNSPSHFWGPVGAKLLEIYRDVLLGHDLLRHVVTAEHLAAAFGLPLSRTKRLVTRVRGLVSFVKEVPGT